MVEKAAGIGKFVQFYRRDMTTYKNFRNYVVGIHDVLAKRFMANLSSASR